MKSIREQVTIKQWVKKGTEAYKQRNWAEALEWLLKAAEKGDAKAMLLLGNMYQYGWGVEEDWGKALDYYSEASDKGNGEAGYMHEQLIHIINLSI